MAALIVSAVGMLSIGSVVFLGDGKRGRLFWFTVIGMPLSPIANVVLKEPLTQYIGMTFGIESLHGAPVGFLVLVVLVAPVIEEFVKLLPLCIKRLRSWAADHRRTVYCGLATGLGFGLGENGYLASMVARNDPITAMMPFYLLNGFMAERGVSMFAHGVFSALAVAGAMCKGKTRMLLVASAILAHALSNLPSLLFQVGTISDQTASMSLIVIAVLLGLVFFCLARAMRAAGRRM